MNFRDLSYYWASLMVIADSHSIGTDFEFVTLDQMTISAFLRFILPKRPAAIRIIGCFKRLFSSHFTFE